MTVIVAIPEDGTVHMAADGSNTVHGGCHPMPAVPGGKIVVKTSPEPLAIGVTGAYRITQEIRYRWKPPDVRSVKTSDRALVKILDHLQNHLLAKNEQLKGFIIEDDEPRTLVGGEFLIGFRSRVYVVLGDFCFLECRRGFGALGSAMDVATGALFASQGEPVEKRLTVALDACCEYRDEVRPPYEFVSLEPAKTT